ncbi:MAG: hypothetical protein WC785_07720 [Tatlockia sp.]|jgi:hypothetical protein
MILKHFVTLCLIATAFPSSAFNCYFTLVKDSCWTDYDVTVEVIDTTTNKSILTTVVPIGKSWVRTAFTCQPSQQFIYHATYKPIFWRSEIGKVYTGVRYLSLPAKVKKGQSAWEIPVCYPKAFATVPLPPDANNRCQCDFKSIPPIKMQ